MLASALHLASRSGVAIADKIFLFFSFLFFLLGNAEGHLGGFVTLTPEVHTHHRRLWKFFGPATLYDTLLLGYTIVIFY